MGNNLKKYHKKIAKKPFGIFKNVLCSYFFTLVQKAGEGENNYFDEILMEADTADDGREMVHYDNVPITDVLRWLRRCLLKMNKVGIHGMNPSNILCEVLKQTEITVNKRMFKLPFDPFIIKLPKNEYGFSYSIMRVGDEILNILLMDDGMLNMFTNMGIGVRPGDKATDKECSVIRLPMQDDIENVFSTDAIKKHSSKNIDVSDLVRICINAVLYLNTKKTGEITIRNPDDSIRKIPIQRPEIKIKEYGFLQEITIRQKRVEVSEGDGTGGPRSPHWRRGHWRTQCFGKGNEKTKLIFIEPVYINIHLLKGDMKNTGAIYK